MSAPRDTEAPAGDAGDNDYVSRTGQSEIPVTKDDQVEASPYDGGADSDEQLEKDDKDAINKDNIIDERTRGATKQGAYREPGDEEGLGDPEDGRSRVAGGPN